MVNSESMQDDIALQRLFAVQLLDINGIFHTDCTCSGLSDEFLGEAETYDERYFDSDSLRGPLRDAFSEFNLGPAPIVLDLGAGSGTSVIPTLELLPQARVVATDLSPQLLCILRRRLAQRGLADRCWTVKADISHAGIVRDQSFDLIVGNAILHHLLRPDQLLREVCRWLRPGGRAVFFEPFASGQLCFGLLCERLAVDSERLGLSSDIVSLLGKVIHDIRVRLSGTVPYEQLQDKWLFTRPYLEAALAGVGEVLVTPAEPSGVALERQFRRLMKRGLGLDELPALDAVWKTLRIWDPAFGPLFQELILRGRIVVRRNLDCSKSNLAIPAASRPMPETESGAKARKLTPPNPAFRGRRMNVLIATNRLISFTGSEVIALELAEAFRAKGHVPLLFTNAISQQLLKHANERGLEVVWEHCPALSSFDIVWSQHYLLPLLLDGALPAAGASRPFTVCAHLSPQEPYEAATPVIEDMFAHEVFANSAETRAALLTQGIAAGVKIFPNPAPSAFAVERARTTGNLSRILVITNHIPTELRDALKILADETGIDVTHIGHGGTLKRVMPEDLAGCDAMVTIGKSTQYALLARIPVYCYDIFGGPGWLNDKNFAAAEYHNFSGRCCRRQLAAREIASEITSGFRPALHFAANLNSAEMSRFVLDAYIESLIEAASRRPRWSAAEAERLSQNAGQITRVHAMALAIRREVATLEQGREEAVALARGLAEAQDLVQKQQADLCTYDRALGEAQRLVLERETDLRDLDNWHRTTMESLTRAERSLADREVRILHLTEVLAQNRSELTAREEQLCDSAARFSEAGRQVAILDQDLSQAREELERKSASLLEVERLHNDCSRQLWEIETSLIWRLSRLLRSLLPLRGLPRS